MSLSSKPRKKLPFWQRQRHSVRKRLISGLAVVVPLGVTALVLRMIYDFTAGRIAPFAQRWLFEVPPYAVVIFSVTLFFLLVYFVGLVASVMIGRRIIGLAEALLDRIPLVKSVYSASKQFVEAITLREQGASFQAAAFVNFPSKDMKAIGFLSGTIVAEDGSEYYRVFIPTTPNITVGLFQVMAAEDVFFCDIPIEDMIKMTVSGGVLGPDHAKLTCALEKLPPTEV